MLLIVCLKSEKMSIHLQPFGLYTLEVIMNILPEIKTKYNKY